MVDAQITFEADADGKADALVLHQNGVDQRAKRIEGEPVLPKEIAVEPRCSMAMSAATSMATATVHDHARRGLSCSRRSTGQPKVEIFARSATEFFYTVVEAQITFERDAQGKATALVLHQMGRDLRWTRVE